SAVSCGHAAGTDRSRPLRAPPRPRSRRSSFISARALTEVAAAHILVIGYWLLDPGSRVTSRRRLFAAGLLFGLVCLLHLQLAPAAAILALWPLWRTWRTAIPALLVGAFVAIAAGAILDWAALGYPLASLWRGVLYNLVYG